MAILIDSQAFDITSRTEFVAVVPNQPWTRLLVSCARKIGGRQGLWADDIDLDIRIDLSRNGGNSWTTWTGFTAEGGVLKRIDGLTDAPASSINHRFPSGNNWQIRCAITPSTRVPALPIRLVSELTVEVR